MSLRILVVEPEPHAREGLRTILTADGHAVSAAEDVWAGFSRLGSQTFDVLVVDADIRPQRPVAPSVLDLLRFARRRSPRTHGILISALADEVPRGLSAEGVLTVFDKPIELARLRNTLQALASSTAEPRS